MYEAECCRPRITERRSVGVFRAVRMVHGEANGDVPMTVNISLRHQPRPTLSSGLSIFVLLSVAALFIVVFALLAYVVIRFRKKRNDDQRASRSTGARR